ncbi:MAG: beta-lactamase family protein [Oscillospiraceae bacterium]|nr:beta-lactamase family protein [Oscillospiraceae bacterium]
MKMKKTMALFAAALMTVSALSIPASAAEPANKPYTTNATLSGIGSVSKTYAAVAVMQLYDQGKLDIDAPVTDYLPDFRMADPRYKSITPRMLMNHTSGLMGTTMGDFMLFDDRDTRPHDTLLQELSTQRLKADPGAFGAYCNDGFTLLELLVEEVSGESFTDYLENHICKPLGLEQTGSVWNAFRTPEQVATYQGGSIRYAPDYCMNIGSGGILSTAAEVCTFGSAFFTGDNRLLSEKAKQEMEKTSVTDAYQDGFGLGFDAVSQDDYAAAGVKVISKGGDLLEQHGGLVIAPDEQISVAVLSSGGSSMYNELMAQALMDIALGEKGITVEHPTAVQKETLDTVPEQYLDMAGLYLSAEGLCQLSFPDGKYMEITTMTHFRPKTERFLYTTEDSFVLVEGNIAEGKAVQAKAQRVLHFTRRSGIDYITEDSYNEIGSEGRFTTHSYTMQRLDANPVSEAAQAAWDARSCKKYYVYDLRYSNVSYLEMPSYTLETFPEAPSYVSGMKIIDETHAQAALTMPGGRDLRDITIRQENGTEFLDVTNLAMSFIAEEAIPALPSDLTEVALHSKQAAWYSIGEAENQTLTLDIPAHAAVYVYDSYDRMTYSSYMTGYGNRVPLPNGGKIVFLGEDGEVIHIEQ